MSEQNLSYQERCDKAIDLLFVLGGYDGSEHKMYAIDQALRILTGDEYEALIREYENEDEEEYKKYSWEVGIAP